MMAAPMDPHAVSDSETENRLCEIHCTVVTGFERVAKEDIEDQLGCNAEILGRGNVTAFVPFKEVRKVGPRPVPSACQCFTIIS